MSVDWGKIGDQKYERIVDSLVSQKWHGIADLTYPNGRGGDGGIDIEVRQGDHRRIYQLKVLPGRLLRQHEDHPREADPELVQAGDET